MPYIVVIDISDEYSCEDTIIFDSKDKLVKWIMHQGLENRYKVYELKSEVPLDIKEFDIEPQLMLGKWLYYKEVSKNLDKDYPAWSDLSRYKQIEYVEKVENIDNIVKEKYNEMIDNDPKIHSNRFPTWEELPLKEKEYYREKFSV